MLPAGHQLGVEVLRIGQGRLQGLVRGVELQEEHDEDPVIGDLLELSCSDIMVNEEDASNNAENFVKQVDLKT